MSVKVITPPAQQISTADLKAHLRATSNDEDSLIVGYLAGAVDACRLYMARSIGTQVLEEAYDAFPSGAIELLFGPVASVVSVTYVDENGATQTVSSANYVLDNHTERAWVVPVEGFAWPITKGVVNAVKIRYNAGDMPASVKTALLLMVGATYDNRDESALDIQTNPGLKLLLDPWKLRVGMA